MEDSVRPECAGRSSGHADGTPVGGFDAALFLRQALEQARFNLLGDHPPAAPRRIGER